MSKIYNTEESARNIIKVKPSETNLPDVFKAKYKELISLGFTEDYAKQEAGQEIELEVYYDTHSSSLFCVESEATDNTSIIYNPYQGELMEDSDE